MISPVFTITCNHCLFYVLKAANQQITIREAISHMEECQTHQANQLMLDGITAKEIDEVMNGFNYK
jgi:hypothetical protein